MNDPSTYWLTITNIVLGLVTLICCGAIAIGVVQELAAKRKKRTAMSELDREVTGLMSAYDGHAFHSPTLGLTMADGGEKLGEKDKG